jgi:tripartite-type tricarboxylate transporter receptor subunit TctC
VIRLAKATPGKIAYASSGNGSAQHLAGALFESRTGSDLVHVPYRGGGPALNDVMGGQVPLFFANVASSLGNIQSGRLRPLAVTSRLPSRALPEIASMEQSGVANFEVLEWNPVKKTMAEPEVLARVRSLGGEVFADNAPTATAIFLKAQQSLWAKVIKERNITVG